MVGWLAAPRRPRRRRARRSTRVRPGRAGHLGDAPAGHPAAAARGSGATTACRAHRGRIAARPGWRSSGTRGIPANYGGFETFAEQLALRLVGDGTTRHRLLPAATSPPARQQWRGIRLVTLPTIRSKYLDTVVHTSLSALHLVLTRGPRDVLLCNAANAPVVPFLRLCPAPGRPQRRRAGVASRQVGRARPVVVPHGGVAVGPLRLGAGDRRGGGPHLLPRAARHRLGDGPVRRRAAGPRRRPAAGRGTGRSRTRSSLYVSRWERENNPLLVARAHAAAGAPLGLVCSARPPTTPTSRREVRGAPVPDAVLPGAVYGDGYRGLLSNARCYVHATEVGGTHPALVEAMGAGNLCLVLDTPENREVAGDAAWYFADADELATLLRRVDELAPADLERVRDATRGAAAARYSWDRVAADYDRLLFGGGGGQPPAAGPAGPRLHRAAAQTRGGSSPDGSRRRLQGDPGRAHCRRRPGPHRRGRVGVGPVGGPGTPRMARAADRAPRRPRVRRRRGRAAGPLRRWPGRGRTRVVCSARAGRAGRHQAVAPHRPARARPGRRRGCRRARGTGPDRRRAGRGGGRGRLRQRARLRCRRDGVRAEPDPTGRRRGRPVRGRGRPVRLGAGALVGRRRPEPADGRHVLLAQPVRSRAPRPGPRSGSRWLLGSRRPWRSVGWLAAPSRGGRRRAVHQQRHRWRCSCWAGSSCSSWLSSQPGTGGPAARS